MSKFINGYLHMKSGVVYPQDILWDLQIFPPLMTALGSPVLLEQS